MAVPDVLPMLAAAGVPRSLAGWWAEPKLDGWRARVLVDEEGVRVRTRSGRDVTTSVPVAFRLADAGHEMVLDGELVAGAGVMADFARLGPALARRTPGFAAVTFVPFDLIWLDGELLAGVEYTQRRLTLEGLPLGVPVVPRFSFEDAPALLAACAVHGVEGVVLKDGGAPYLPGVRSLAWRKVKVDAWQDHVEGRFRRNRPPTALR